VGDSSKDTEYTFVMIGVFGYIMTLIDTLKPKKPVAKLPFVIAQIKEGQHQGYSAEIIVEVESFSFPEVHEEQKSRERGQQNHRFLCAKSDEEGSRHDTSSGKRPLATVNGRRRDQRDP